RRSPNEHAPGERAHAPFPRAARGGPQGLRGDRPLRPGAHVADPAPEGAERDRRVAGEGDDERRVLLWRDRLPLGPLGQPHGRRAREGGGDRAGRLRGRRRRARRPRASPPSLVTAPVAPASRRAVVGVLAATALAYVALAFVPDRTHRVAREASAWAA